MNGVYEQLPGAEMLDDGVNDITSPYIFVEKVPQREDERQREYSRRKFYI